MAEEKVQIDFLDQAVNIQRHPQGNRGEEMETVSVLEWMFHCETQIEEAHPSA